MRGMGSIETYNVGKALLLLDPFAKEAGLAWARTDVDDVVDVERILFRGCIWVIMHDTEGIVGCARLKEKSGFEILVVLHTPLTIIQFDTFAVIQLNIPTILDLLTILVVEHRPAISECKWAEFLTTVRTPFVYHRRYHHTPFLVWEIAQLTSIRNCCLSNIRVFLFLR